MRGGASLAQQCFFNHPPVAARMRRRHAAFVGGRDRHPPPVQIALRQKTIAVGRRATAGQRNARRFLFRPAMPQSPPPFHRRPFAQDARRNSERGRAKLRQTIPSCCVALAFQFIECRASGGRQCESNASRHPARHFRPCRARADGARHVARPGQPIAMPPPTRRRA